MIKLFLSVFFLIVYFVANAQQIDTIKIRAEADSLKAAADSLRNAWRLNEALETYKAALTKSRQIGDTEKEAVELYEIGKIHFYQSNIKDALDSWDKTLTIHRKLNDQSGIGKILNSLGTAYDDISNYSKALEYLHRSLEISRELGDLKGQAKTLNNIGVVFNNLSDYPKALEYYQQSLEIYRVLEDRRGEGEALNNIGTVYMAIPEYNKPLDYFRRYLNICQEIGDRIGESIALSNIGVIYNSLSDYPKALDYLHRSLEISRELGDRNSEAQILNNIGSLYLKTNDYNKALLFIEKGLKVSEEIGGKSLIKDCYYSLSDLYYKQNNYRKALEYYKLYSAIKDSIYNKEFRDKITEMAVRYAARDKENEIDLLKKEKEIRDIELKRQKSIRNLLIALSFLVLILVLITYNRYLNKKKESEVLEEKRNQLEVINKEIIEYETNLKELVAAKDKFFSIISHEFNNSLTSIAGASDMLRDNINEMDTDKKMFYINMIDRASKKQRELVENLMQWSMSQTGMIIYKPGFFYLKEITASVINLLEINAKKKNINVVSEINESAVAYADKDMIETVLRNLISNAIKFTYKGGEVKITCEDKGDYMIVAVIDSGVGIDEENKMKLFNSDIRFTTLGTAQEKGTGLGLKICKDYVEKNKGKIWVESRFGKGSIFKFTLPKMY